MAYQRNTGYVEQRYRYMVRLVDSRYRYEFLTDTLDHPDLSTHSIANMFSGIAEQEIAMSLKPEHAAKGVFTVVIHEETAPYCYVETDVPFVESEIAYHVSTLKGGD